MRLTFFVVWKSWVSNPVRTVLTILGVAIGIAVVTAIHVLDHNTIQSRLHQRLADYGHVDLELLPKDADAPAAEGLAGFMLSWGLTGVPITIVFCVLSLVGWFICYYAVYLTFDYPIRRSDDKTGVQKYSLLSFESHWNVIR